MAITHIASVTNTGTATPAAVNAPATRQSGDFLIVNYAQDSTSRTLTTPGGWTLRFGGPLNTTSHRGYVYTRIADGTATDNFSATLSGATTWMIGMGCYRGVHATTPIDASGSVAESAAVAQHVSPSITPTINDSFIVAVFSIDSGTPTKTFTADGTATERYDAGEGGAFVSITAVDEAGPNPAAGVTKSVTQSSATDRAVIGIFALKPAGGATQYNQSVSGALANTALTGAMAKQPQRALAGTVSNTNLTAALVKQTARAVVGTVSNTDLTALLAGAKLTLVSLSGAISSGQLTGALAIRTQRALAGTVALASLTGTLVKQTQRALAGAVSNTDLTALLAGSKVSLVNLSGALSSSGALVTQTRRALAGALADVASAFSKQTQRGVAGVLSNTDLTAILTGTRVSLVSLVGALSSGQLTGTLAVQTRRALAGLLAPLDGALVKRTGRSFAGTISNTNLTAALSGSKVAVVALAGTLSAVTGSLTKQTGRALSALVTPAGARIRAMGRALAGALSSGDLFAVLTGSRTRLVALAAVLGASGQVTGLLIEAGEGLVQGVLALTVDSVRPTMQAAVSMPTITATAAQPSIRAEVEGD